MDTLVNVIVIVCVGIGVLVGAMVLTLPLWFPVMTVIENLPFK